MSFVSPLFFIFIPVFLLGTICTRGNVRILFYIVMSYLFYAYSFPPYVIILFFSSFVDFHVGRRISRTENKHKKYMLLCVSIMVNIGLLFTFKYAGFFIRQINDLRLCTAFTVPNLILPVGISFYTFQTLSYTIDIYRNKIKPTSSFFDFACYVAFFPQLVAGPIIRAAEFLPQLKKHVPLKRENTIRGMELVIQGFVKKLIFADNLARVVDEIFLNHSQYGGGVLWIGSLFYAMQIYCDFSGYTDIARGIGRILGFKFPHNFNWPYLSISIREFWQNWHMSLSYWLRDYLYIPLGGSRVRVDRYLFNILFVFLLCGLWHGAGYNFIIWGIYHGLLVVGSKAAMSIRIISNLWSRVPGIVNIFFTFLVVTIGWVIFRVEKTNVAFLIIKKMLCIEGNDFFMGFVSIDNVSYLIPLFLFGAALHIISYKLKYNIDGFSLMTNTYYPVRIVVLALVITILMLSAPNQRSFIYFRF
jgi:alginate O-acetyltransferase complex protein AlgI